MKSNLIFLLSFVLSIPLVSFATNTNSKTVDVQSPIIVADKQLTPGTYKVEWNGNGPDVQVVFMRNHKDVVTAPAKLVRESSADAEAGPALVMHKNRSSNVLDEIDFKNLELRFHRIPTGA